MNTTTHPASDLEALSALFDGELGGDAARFALKRLDHDREWRQACERWSRGTRSADTIMPRVTFLARGRSCYVGIACLKPLRSVKRCVPRSPTRLSDLMCSNLSCKTSRGLAGCRR